MPLTPESARKNSDAGHAAIPNHHKNGCPQNYIEPSERTDATVCDCQNDGTAGHSKGKWELDDAYPNLIFTRKDGTRVCVAESDFPPDQQLLLLAQHAPHDCGDPECPGVQNKRKLELYDKFQRAIHEFANAGLLT